MADQNSPGDPNRFKFRSYAPSEGRGARIMYLVFKGILVLLAIILIVLIIRQIRHYFIAKPAPTLPSPTYQTSNSPKKATNPPKKTSGSTNPSNLPNNGPGDTAAIFAGVTLLATGAHLVLQARRQSTN